MSRVKYAATSVLLVLAVATSLAQTHKEVLPTPIKKPHLQNEVPPTAAISPTLKKVVSSTTPTIIDELILRVTQKEVSSEAFDEKEVLSTALEKLLHKKVLLEVSPAISGQCFSHLVHYLLQIQAGTTWALHMMDATTKVPDGILYGSLSQMGNFDECLAVRVIEAPGNSTFQGRYFRTALFFTLLQETPIKNFVPIEVRSLFNNISSRSFGGVSQTPVTWSLCLPSSCTPEDAGQIVQQFVPPLIKSFLNISLVITAVPIPRQDYVQTTTHLEPRDWIVIALHCVLVLLVLGSTAMDYYHTKTTTSTSYQLMNSFSARRTCRELFSTRVQPGTLGCLHGLRVFSILWIILAHRFSMSIYFPLSNILVIFEKVKEVPIMTIMNATVAVDTFFFLSGLLVCYGFLRETQQKMKKFNVLKFYLYRYMRLVVPMLIVMSIYMTVLTHVGTGPMWNGITTQAEVCRANWWNSVLYVNNYINVDKTCIGQTWYLAVDMQLAWFSPLVLLPLKYSPRAGLQITCLLTLASAFFTFTMTYLNNYSWSINFLDQLGSLDYYNNIYIPTHARASTYFCGILTGYFLYKRKDRKIDLSAGYVALGWLCSTGICLTVIYSLSIVYQTGFVYNNLEAAFYSGFHRLGWTIALAWIVVACVHGHGGPVDKILAWGPLQPLSKLTYGAYLTHVMVVMYDVGVGRTVGYFSYYSSTRDFFGDLPFVFAMALYLYLTVEGPLMALLRIVFKKG